MKSTHQSSFKSRERVSLLRGALSNERGQTAIFVALIFQVLFVFFAMVINVGLLVHDKINLQNSVDLAAYYAAGKQAEMLNAIAHSNYQIRQSWKLLAWRLRVLGDMGRDDHPLRNPQIPLEEKPLGNAGRLPTVCVKHTAWTDEDPHSEQNLCRNSYVSIPEIPNIPVIAGFLGFNQAVSNFGKEQRQVFQKTCEYAGPADWTTAVVWLAAYRLDIGNRKKVIRKLADELSAQRNDFRDPTGASVFEGANNTFLKNLTRTNRDTASLELFNSLGGISRTQWLNEVFVFPLAFYSDFEKIPNRGCVGKGKLAIRSGPGDLPASFNTSPLIKQQFDPKDLLKNATGEPMYPPDANQELSAYHSSTGVEKNPWYMAYVGIKASTKPRKPFAPFGTPVTLVARAYAKPFGGKIGPWANSQWPRESTRSSGGTPVDPLLPHAPDEGEKPVFTAASVPNYSRFPGDQLGLNSKLALGQFRNTGFKDGKKLSRSFWGFLPGDLDQPDGDVMAWTKLTPPDPSIPNPTPHPWIRDLEIAAIVPDLFDITYYSIDGNFYRNYIQPSVNMFGEGVRPRADLGSREQDNIFYTVKAQINEATKFFDPTNFYNVDQFDHLFTGWIPSGPYEYTGINDQYFGHCLKEGLRPVPGGCAAGGRAGYSVKIISNSYLNEQNLNLGGEGTAGGIKNPPPW